MDIGKPFFALFLGFQQLLGIVFHIAQGGGGHISYRMQSHNQGQIFGHGRFAFLPLPTGVVAVAACERSHAASLVAGVHVAFVIVADIHDMFVSFGSAAQGLETDIAGITITGETADGSIYSRFCGNSGIVPEALEATPVMTQA